MAASKTNTLSVLCVADAGVPKAVTATALPPDNIHITDGCDTTAQLSQSGANTGGKIVAHGEGTRVDMNHPANVGEELVMYAFGRLAPGQKLL